MRSRFDLPLAALAAFVLPGAAPHAQQVEARLPDATVKAAVERTMAAVRSDAGARGGDPERIVLLVRQHFLPATDFALSTRYAVGASWATATPAQREALAREFQTLLARTFALQLTQVREQDTRFQYAPGPAPAPGAVDAVVRSTVLSGGEAMPIDYRLRKTEAGWKIYDINMMGVWMIQVYQRQFAARIAGGGIDGLIKYLEAHNRAE